MATSRRQFLRSSAAVGAAGLTFGLPASASAETARRIRSHPDAITVALIGDYGSGSSGQGRVSRMVHGWKPSAVFTMGDNVYSFDEGLNPNSLIKTKVAGYYGKFIANETFFPSLGNHDWGDPGTPIIQLDGQGGTTGAWHDVFHYLPGNGRYYDVRVGNLHAFVVHDYFREPDGNRLGSKQAAWLESAARSSDAAFKIVIHHYAPYVSSVHANKRMRWPYGEWGIDTSFTGHWHHYERRKVDGVQYVVNGLGGASKGFSGDREPEVESLYVARHGASRLTITPDDVLVEFLSDDGVVRDSFTQALEPGANGVGSVPTIEPETEPPVEPEPDGPLADEPYTSSTGRAAVVARLYLAVFERQPDPNGFTYWTGVDASISHIAGLFVASPEFLLRYGSLDNSQFVDRVYRNVLGRAPDASGRSYWTRLLDDGTTRGDIMIGFSESTEFRRRSGIAG